VVETNAKAREISGVTVPDLLDQLLGLDAILLRFQHDGRAVGIVGADI